MGEEILARRFQLWKANFLLCHDCYNFKLSWMLL